MVAVTFHAQLRALRLGRGLTQKGLGAMVGQSNWMVSFWEAGRRVPDEAHIARLAAALGVRRSVLGPRSTEAPYPYVPPATTAHDCGACGRRIRGKLGPPILSADFCRDCAAPITPAGVASCPRDGFAAAVRAYSRGTLDLADAL